ncbi:MAG TPA: VOC family protein [Bryobacteraceae bacterium]|jgi:hypothetical protein|nr:VOC family protein [Bryobacteraceae bacterium]
MLPLDHVTVAGPALAPMRAALAAIGIPTVYGGGHRDGATEMALASFSDGSYLELIAPPPNAPVHIVDGHPWSRYLTGSAGPCAWAVRTTDLDGELRRLRAAGIAASGPAANGRRRPDGVQLEWQIAAAGPGGPGTFFPFAIQDFTAHDLRAFPSGAPTAREYRCVSRVVLAVHDLEAAATRYRQAYGLTAFIRHTDRAFGAELIVAADAPVVLAQPLAADSWLAARIQHFGEVPCAILLEGAASIQTFTAHSTWGDLHIGWFRPDTPGWRLAVCQ